MTEWTGGITVDEHGPYRVISIENGERNLLNPGVMAEVVDALRSAEAAEGIEGVILTGDGTVFCGGLDVPAIQAGADPVEFANSLFTLLALLPKLGIPVVAAVNGDAVASGASVVAACDFAVGHSGTRVGTYEVSIGIWPMIAQVPVIKAIGARAAMENVGSGEPFNAQRAHEVGLLQRIVEQGQEVDTCVEWLTNARRAGAVYAAGRRSLYEFGDMPYEAALQESLERFTAMFR